jgi:hypothetical protein
VLILLIKWWCLLNPKPITKKEKLKLWRLPQIEVFYGKNRAPSFWFIYMGEDGRIGGQTKQYGIKLRCYYY